MLDIQIIRDTPDAVKSAIVAKGIGSPELVDQFLLLDDSWRRSTRVLQELQSEVNALSKEVGLLMKAGRKEEAQSHLARTAELKERIKQSESEVRLLAERRDRLALDFPNIPHPSVPEGRTPEDNAVVYEWGTKPIFPFPVLAHWDLLERHGMVDFERGSKVTGAGFPFYVGAGARLQRALIQFFLDLAVSEGGYTEMQPPIFVNAASATATGQLPDKEDLMYEVVREGLYPVPTAEVPVTNFYRDEILDEERLPIRYCAYTPCFRREAGSHGKDVRGLNRLHQFDKVELVHFVHPERSYEALEHLREDAERALQRLGLPYRRLLMCTGDMGFTQSKKYDLEVWSAGQERWLEVSSISNFEAFQARRAGIRYRPSTGGRPAFIHTLNGSGLAIPRVVAALVENGQQADGSIALPTVLQSAFGSSRIG